MLYAIYCMFVTVPVVHEPSDTPTFHVLSKGTSLNVPQQTDFRVEISIPLPRLKHEALPFL